MAHASPRGIDREAQREAQRDRLKSTVSVELIDLIDSKGALVALGSQNLPSSRDSFQLAVTIRSVNKYLEVYDEKRVKLLEEYGYKPEQLEGHPPAMAWQFKTPEQEKRYNVEFKNLTSLIVEVRGTKFTSAQLGSPGPPPNNRAALHWLISDFDEFNIDDDVETLERKLGSDAAIDEGNRESDEALSDEERDIASHIDASHIEAFRS